MNDTAREHDRRTARRLVVATLAYNVVEACAAIWSGIAAASIALVGFGLDSMLEVVAAGALLARLRLEARGADQARVESAEHRVHRVVGITLLLLALYVTVQSVITLVNANAPDESTIGIALAILSLIVMPLVAAAKLRVADRIGSPALRAEAKETLACSYLSFTLLLGLGANALFGAWWADPAAALLMIPWLVKEGLEGVRGEHHAE